MDGSEKIDTEEISDETGVEEEDVEEVLWHLIRNSWLFSNHVKQFSQ